MTYRELLSRVDDLRALAIPPVPGERSGCMSSFDRRSQYDGAADVYRNWDANDDGSGCIRRLEDGSIVAFEMEGPGVIWRIWSALPLYGHMRVYLDDASQPAIDVPFIDWFERSPGEIPPLNLSELSARLSRGRNSFVPIPFRRYCRVELAPEWGNYYHFTYTRFSDGTELPDYAERFTTDGSIALAELDRRLYERGEGIVRAEPIEANVPAGKARTIWQTTGSGAIVALEFDARALARLPEASLRRILLEITWDDDASPAVLAPIGDFFGSAPGVSRFRALPLSMDRHALACRWYMPFSRGARIVVRNLTDQDLPVALCVDVESCPNADRLLRFHARWHRDPEPGDDAARFAPGGDRWPDWPLLIARGPGRFCGVHLHVYNAWTQPDMPADTWWYGQWDRKSIDWWWGEGDEKFFVDGEKFPSTFGTGSEDYIGYAWAAEPPFARFEHAFACMSRMPIDGNGHTSVSRFHIADNIPFMRSFEGYIEKYKANFWHDQGASGKCLYAATPYWYQAPETDAGNADIRPNALWGEYHL